MSGIVGMINLDGAPVDRELLWRLTDFMSYRGPDAQQVWIDHHIGLGHTLLRATIEAENEKQPTSLDGKVWLIADARIDDREELLRKLPTSLHPGNLTDAELILCAYEAWGEECVNHLIGDFAFAIWDGRTQRLFCARDHLGVKPFFYAYISNSFIFSNTLDALRLDRRVSDELNEIAIGDYLLFGLNQDLSTTTFGDISRLPAGHTLTVANGTLKTRCYWSPTSKGELHLRDRQSYIEHFDELLTSAVQDRLRTDRVAVSMSGGLDSTSVAAIAHELLKKPNAVHALSVVYDSLIPDEERHYSQAAADHIGISVTHINADQFALFDGAAAEDLHQPEPFLLSPLMGQFNALLRLCAEHGRVALTGWDGDALMNEPVNSYLSSAVRTLRLKDFVCALACYVKTQRRVPGLGIRRRVNRVFGKQNAPAFYPEWIDESFAKRTNLRERLLEYSSIQNNLSETRPVALRALASKVWASLFEGYDAGATRLPLELRHPFIDLRLVEFLLAVPAVPWCVEKHILRVAMQRRLPTNVLNRHKTPLGGDPALQMTRRASVRCLDSFEVNPQLRCFVNLNQRPSIAEEQTPDGIWSSLRVFALNHWLSNSQPKDRVESRKLTSSVEAISETSIA
jgi:asparagine synthase (glutamine-hydrolysing)